MVVIRLSRKGAKKSPFYHIVATDKRNSRDGRFIERLGFYNPVARGQAVRLEVAAERVQHWIDQGAQPSERVSSLLKQFAQGMTAAIPHAPKKPAAAPKVEEPKAEAPKAEAPKAEEPKAEAPNAENTADKAE